MRLEFHYKNLQRSEALESYVEEKLDASIGGLHREELHIQVWLVAENSKFAKGAPSYKCEFELRYPPRRDIFVQKSNPDIYSAVHEAALALKTLSRSEGKKEIQKSHHSSKVAG